MEPLNIDWSHKITALLIASDVRWVGKGGRSQHGLAIRRVWFNHLLMLDTRSRSFHLVPVRSITDYLA